MTVAYAGANGARIGDNYTNKTSIQVTTDPLFTSELQVTLTVDGTTLLRLHGSQDNLIELLSDMLVAVAQNEGESSD